MAGIKVEVNAGTAVAVVIDHRGRKVLFDGVHRTAKNDALFRASI